MAKVLFYTATAAQFASLTTKNPDALYFITDQNRIYKGNAPYSNPVEIVSAFPSTGVAGTLYISSGNYEAKIWSGSAWNTVLPPVETTISGSSTDTQLASAKAVKDYVDSQISGVNSAVDGVVSNVSYVEASKSLSVKKGTSDAVVTQLKGFVDGASYNGSTGVLTFTTNGGTPITVNLPVENFLSSASFNADDNVLTLTLSDGTEVTVNLAELVDTYTVDSTSTIALSMSSGGKITGSVKVSAESGNQLSAKNDGLFVAATDVSGKMSKVTGTAGTLLTADAAGNATRTDKKVVTTLTNLDTDVPTTKAVTTVTSAIDTKAANAATAADTAQTTADAKMAKKSGTANTVILGDADGETVRSSKSVGGATLAASPSENTLATEAAVAAALSWNTL